MKIGKLLELYKPHKFNLYKNIVLNILATLSMLLQPHLIKLAIDKYIVTENISGLIKISIIYLLNTGFSWIISILQIRNMVSLGQRILNDLREKTFSHIQNLSMSFFDKTKQGTLISRLDNDILSLEWTFIWGLGIFISSIITLSGAIYFMVRYNLKLCLYVVIIIPLIIVATELFRRNALNAYKQIRESIARITANFAETISGIKVIQSFVREDHNMITFNSLNLSHISNTLKAANIWSKYVPFLTIISVTGVIIVLTFGGNFVIKGELKIGELTAFILYLNMFFGPITMLGELYNQILSSTTSLDRIFEILSEKPEIEIKDTKTHFIIPQMKGEVIFENVYFKYNNSDTNWILKNININVKPGQTIAIVGKTGSGKTSIINLIPRFYEIQHGRILIDGYNIKDIDINFLRSKIGFVYQENFLFTGTIMDNLKYGDSKITDTQVKEASKLLGLHKFIKRLPDEYFTEVKERGEGLSIGERQLICFTRALLINPKILILDEATSSVDSYTEFIIHRALKKLIKDRTSFIVAQRLSTVRQADIVIVIKDGEIVEQGTHISLLKHQGIYAKLYREFIKI